MNNIEILSRRKALEKKMKEIERKEEKIAKSLSKIKESCNHEIMYERTYSDERCITRPYTYTYCLFCGIVNPYKRKMITRELHEKMKNSIVISMKDYPKFAETSEDEIIELQKMYLNLRKKFPDYTEIQIAEEMKKKLKQKLKLKEEIL